MTQPAERMSKVPSAKIQTISQSGRPADENHKAQSVGQSSSSVPIGLSRRIKRS